MWCFHGLEIDPNNSHRVCNCSCFGRISQSFASSSLPSCPLPPFPRFLFLYFFLFPPLSFFLCGCVCGCVLGPKQRQPARKRVSGFPYRTVAPTCWRRIVQVRPSPTAVEMCAICASRPYITTSCKRTSRACLSVLRWTKVERQGARSNHGPPDAMLVRESAITKQIPKLWGKLPGYREAVGWGVAGRGKTTSQITACCVRRFGLCALGDLP